MGELEFGIFDSFGPFEMKEFPSVAEVYEAHLHEAQEAEQLGYRYYFFIEHQNSPVCYVTSPTVFLTALASRTSTLRFGLMIYQLPFHHPIRLAQDLATLDQLSRGRLEFGTGTGVLAHEFMRWNLPFDQRHEMSLRHWRLSSRRGRRKRSPTRANTGSSTRPCPIPNPTRSPIHPFGLRPIAPAPSSTPPSTTITSRRTSMSMR